MAKLTSLIKFNGTIDELTAYEMEGVKGVVVRKRTGPTKDQIQTDPRFVNVNRINKETAGRSEATGFVLDTLGALRPVVDQSCCGRLNATLMAVQEMDSQSPWGQRHVRLTQRLGLLEGFNLRKVYPLEQVIRNPLYCTVEKNSLRAEVEVPALLQGVNFFSPQPQPLFRVVASMGVVPDLFYDSKNDHYFPAEGFERVSAQSVMTEWFPVKGGSAATTLSIHLPNSSVAGAFSLVLTMGVQWGTIGIGGSVDVVKKVKSARIERVV